MVPCRAIGAESTDVAGCRRSDLCEPIYFAAIKNVTASILLPSGSRMKAA